MFCRVCGKEVDADAKFCHSCGQVIGTVQHQNYINTNSVTDANTFWGTLSEIGSKKIVNALSIVTAVTNFLIWLNSRETYTEYELLYQEDYLITSEEGKEWMLIVTVIYAVLSFSMMFLLRKEDDNKSKSLLKVIAIAAASGILMALKLPAPY